MKGVKKFGKKGKHSPRYVSPYRILNHFWKVSYKLVLPANFAAVHPMFYISLLKKCISDSIFVVPLESMDDQDNLSYEEVPVEILDRQTRRLRIK